ncbi:MAG: ACT domain-containing protein [Methanomassiliicoccales archaeon]|jgi:hypothetical protein
MTLKQFDISVKDKPGEIADIAEVLSLSNVSIRGISTEKRDENAILHIVSEDETATRKALKKAKVKFNERDVFLVQLPYKSNELANVSRRLAAEKVNIESLLVLGGRATGIDEVVIGVDNKEAAKKVLGENA